MVVGIEQEEQQQCRGKLSDGGTTPSFYGATIITNVLSRTQELLYSGAFLQRTALVRPKKMTTVHSACDQSCSVGPGPIVELDATHGNPGPPRPRRCSTSDRVRRSTSWGLFRRLTDQSWTMRRAIVSAAPSQGKLALLMWRSLV